VCSDYFDDPEVDLKTGGNEYNLLNITYLNLFMYYKYYLLFDVMCSIIKFLVFYISLQVVVNMIFVHF